MPSAKRVIPAPSSREKILDVAEALFARSGFAGVGMREVAEQVGLGKSSLFHHFKTKSHLYLEVLGRVLTRIEGVAERSRSDSPTAALVAFTEGLVDDLAEHPPAGRLLLRAVFEEDELSDLADVQQDAVNQQLERIIAGFQATVRQGMACGEFREVSVTDTTQTLIGAILFHFASGEIGEQITHAPIFSAEAVRRRKHHLVDLCRHALVADASRVHSPNPKVTTQES